jgi:bifunctional UDP-N-acetylglucosamine pyrophosphorylase/glucosamine-1-phosphate N-acetyltransferase
MEAGVAGMASPEATDANDRVHQPVGIVLAAGLGTRMRSDLLKVLHPVGGRPMVVRVLTALQEAGLQRAVVVSGHQADALRATVAAWSAGIGPLDIRWAHQAEQRGTGHAVSHALEALDGDPAQHVLVVAGDAPLLDPTELRELARWHRDSGAVATLLTARLPDPTGYGRVLRDDAGQPRAIVEERDASPAQRAVDEVFTLVACFDRIPLARALARCSPTNAQGELYLTDVVAQFTAEGLAVEARVARDADAVLGINDRRGLARAEARVRLRTLDRLMDMGVTVVDPGTTYVDETSTFARDTVLQPMTVIEGGCRIGPRCVVGPGAHLRAAILDADVRVWRSVVEESRLGAGCRVGPFSHLRPGTELGAGVEVGNFAELKNARVGAGSKQHHHSYVGDAELGERVNVGAGVITVNYDGMRKHRTVVGDGAFLGCNANLVAPVVVGADGFVAAGSTVTREVPAGALAIARSRQVNKSGWTAHRRAEASAPSGEG